MVGEQPDRETLADGADAALERVARSPAFQKSPRLRELLLYLGRTSSAAPESSISEHQIGVEVFGRQSGYDASVDTIARVQVSQLRKKLQQYYFTDGAADPVVIEIPKRSYHVVFRPREQATDPAPAGARRSRLLPVLGIALAALAAACVWLALENAKLRTAAGPASPSVDRLWRALAASGREVTVVMADANLMILSDLMGGHTVTLFEYRAQNFPAALLSEYIADPKLRAEAAHIAGTHLTPFQDADVVRTLLPVGLRRRLAMNVVYARDFRLQGNPNNVILLGHKRGNPWVELFEPRMNFRYHYTPEGGAFRAMLVNESLQPGEEKVYPVEFGQHGYADVAYLPKPQGEGAALLVTGTDMSSINAGGHFLTDERAVGKLFEVLKLGGGAVPYFEVLLKTRLLVNTEQGYEIVAHRVVKP